MPRKTTWTYKKKRRRKKDRTFDDECNLDEETVTDSFVPRRETAGTSSESNISMSSGNDFPVKADSLFDNMIQTPIVNKCKRNAPSQLNVSADVSQITCDKLDGGKFVSILQISNDEDEEDKLVLLSSVLKETETKATHSRHTQNKSLQECLEPRSTSKQSLSSPLEKKSIKNQSVSQKNKKEALPALNPDEETIHIQKGSKFPLASIKKEPLDDVPTLSRNKSTEQVNCDATEQKSSSANQITNDGDRPLKTPQLKENNVPLIKVKTEAEPIPIISGGENKSKEKLPQSQLLNPALKEVSFQQKVHIKSEVTDIIRPIPETSSKLVTQQKPNEKQHPLQNLSKSNAPIQNTSAKSVIPVIIKQEPVEANESSNPERNTSNNTVNLIQPDKQSSRSAGIIPNKLALVPEVKNAEDIINSHISIHIKKEPDNSNNQITRRSITGKAGIQTNSGGIELDHILSKKNIEPVQSVLNKKDNVIDPASISMTKKPVSSKRIKGNKTGEKSVAFNELNSIAKQSIGNLNKPNDDFRLASESLNSGFPTNPAPVSIKKEPVDPLEQRRVQVECAHKSIPEKQSDQNQNILPPENISNSLNTNSCTYKASSIKQESVDPAAEKGLTEKLTENKKQSTLISPSQNQIATQHSDTRETSSLNVKKEPTENRVDVCSVNNDVAKNIPPQLTEEIAPKCIQKHDICTKNKIELSESASNSKPPESLLTTKLLTSAPTQVCVVDLETDVVISVQPSKQESMNISPIILSDDDTDIIASSARNNKPLTNDVANLRLEHSLSGSSRTRKDNDIIDLTSPKRTCSVSPNERTKLFDSTISTPNMDISQNTSQISNNESYIRDHSEPFNPCDRTSYPIPSMSNQNTPMSELAKKREITFSEVETPNSKSFHIPTNNCFDIKSSNKSGMPELTTSEATSTSDTKIAHTKNSFLFEESKSDFNMYSNPVGVERLNLDKEKSFEKFRMLQTESIGDKICDKFLKNDKNDIIKLDVFPVSEEEVLAYYNIIEELNNLEKNCKQYEINEYNLARKLNYRENIDFHVDSLDKIPQKLFRSISGINSIGLHSTIYQSASFNTEWHMSKNKDIQIQKLPSKEMLHDIMMNLNSSVQPPALPESTTNLTLPIFDQDDDKLGNSNEAIPAFSLQNSYPSKDQTLNLKPAPENIFKMSSEQLRNILVQTQNYSSISPQPVTSSTENRVSTPDFIPTSRPELEGETNEFHQKEIEVVTPIHNSSFHNSTREASYFMNENCAEINSLSTNNELSQFENSDGPTAMEKSHILINKSYKPVLSPTKDSASNTFTFEQNEAQNDKSATQLNDPEVSSDDDSNINNEFIGNDGDSDCTLPYSEEMDISEDESSRKSVKNKSIAEKPTKYTSKLEKIMQRKRCTSALKEEQIKLKKSKIHISDPKLAKFCEKQREKKKTMIPVINPLPLESEKNCSKKKGNKQSLCDNNKNVISKHENKMETAVKDPIKKDKHSTKKKFVAPKEKVDDVSDLFLPDCKIVRKAKISSKNRNLIEDEASNASVVHYGNRTINRGRFLTETPYEEPPPKIRKKTIPSHSASKPVLSTESMHFMTESPEIKDFYTDEDSHRLTPQQFRSKSISHTTNMQMLENVTNEKKGDPFYKTSEPIKINIEEYSKRKKSMNIANARDPRLSSCKRLTPQSFTSTSMTSSAVNSDMWSPTSSNSSFSSIEKQNNLTGSLLEGISMPTVHTNQDFSNYISHAIPNPTSFHHFSSESSQQGPVSYPLLPAVENLDSINISQDLEPHQYPLPPPPIIPTYFAPHVKQLSKSLPCFETDTPESPFDQDTIPLFHNSLSPKVPSRSIGTSLKHKRCFSLVPKSLRASIGSKLISTENLVMLVLEWNVDWLVQQQKNQSPPPITPSTSLKQVGNFYKTHEDHYNTYLPLLMLELWQRIYHAWTHMTNFVLNCEINSFEPGAEYSNIEFEAVVKDSDVEEKKCPEEGIIVIMRFVSDTGGGIKMLGYVKNVSYTSLNLKYDPKYVRYASNERTQLLRFSVMCAYNATDVNIKEKVRVQLLCNVKPHLKQNDALLGVKESHMEELIIKPEGERVTTVALNTRGIHQEMTVSQSVQDILEGITLPHPLPQLTIVKALPSSDRITTLVRLVEEIKKLQYKIVLCTRTKNALKEIGYNLENCEVDIVILGSKSDVHRKLRKHMLEERALLLVREHSSDCAKVSKESIHRAKKTILSKCDVILSLIQNCHNVDVNESVNEDFERSLMCIIDEANLCTEPEALIPILYGVSKVILIGDPNDPAKVCSKTAIDNNYNRSFFERAYNLNAADLS